MANRTITNDKLYDALNTMRLELKGDIRDLRNQFDQLEAGRLARLEGQFRDFQVSQAQRDNRLDENQATLSGKLIVAGAIAVIILTGLVQAIFSRLIK